MAKPIPSDFDFQMSGAAPLGANVFAFDRAELAPAAGYRSAGMGDWADDYAQMAGVKDWIKKGAKAIASPIKAVGKGVVNAAAAKVGLGPIFQPGQTASVVPHSSQQALAVAPPAPNYTPYIIAGVAGVGLLTVVILATRKK